MAAASTFSPEDAERFRSFERQRHDNLAKTYRDFFTPITALAIKPLFDAIRLEGGIDLLDVATGPGSLAAEAHRLGAKTLGVDLSPGMIELATRSYPGMDFRVAEVEHLPFTDRSFDAVVCNFGLGHFPCLKARPRRQDRVALRIADSTSRTSSVLPDHNTRTSQRRYARCIARSARDPSPRERAAFQRGQASSGRAQDNVDSAP